MYYVYVLHLNNDQLYKGYTENLKRRLKEHHEGKVSSTKPYRPSKLIHYEAYIKRSDAKRREKFLKTTEGRRLLRQQLRNLLADLDIVSK